MRKIRKGNTGFNTSTLLSFYLGRNLSFYTDILNILNPLLQPMFPMYLPQLFNLPSSDLLLLKAGLISGMSNNVETRAIGNAMSDKAILNITRPLDITSSLDEKDLSWKDKFNNSFLGKNSATINTGLDIGNSIFTGIFGERDEYSGKYGDLARTSKAITDTAMDAVGMIPGGLAFLMGYKALDFTNNIMSKIGGGTDGMTVQDALFSNPLLAPIGWVNGFAGKRADTITKDDELFETVGFSYGGTNYTVDDALTKSGKKYGLFSSGARLEANREISEAKRQENIMSDIADNATGRFAIRNSMSAINGNRRAFAMRGGYDQSSVRVGRNGLSIHSILTAKRVVSALKFKPKPVEEPIDEPIVDSFQQGGVLELSLQDVPEEYLEPLDTIEEVTLDSILPEFKEGGTINVIPEGALHARLHHMENADNLTKKGIPVVSEKESGELEQLAEIEREELILRLEVTKRLEELAKENTDEAAIEAGKLLVEEILNNTIDNTNNLL